MMNFQISGLPAHPFQSLFDLSESELRRRGGMRVRADSSPGYPCRVSLEDATVGESLVLIHFDHHAVEGPYRAGGPIYVRHSAIPAALRVNEVPPVVRQRLMSVRAYSETGMLMEAEVAPGSDIDAPIRRLLQAPGVRYLHLHNAKPGCYSCRVDPA